MIVYIETSFLIGHATGRDPGTEGLITSPPPALRLAVPGICFMEAFSLFESERKRINRLADEFQREGNQSRQNLASRHAQDLSGYLVQARASIQDSFDEFGVLLRGAIDRLAMTAEIIPLSPDMIRDCLARFPNEEPTDDLILSCILRHAGEHAATPKAFLSGNWRDFGTGQGPKGRKASELLKDAGIKYFSASNRLMEWHRSLANP